MNLSLSAEELAFRDEVRRFLDANLTEDMRHAGRMRTSNFSERGPSLEWQRRLNAKGWVAPGWPKEYGGTGWSVIQRYIFDRELRLAYAPILPAMGFDMCGPVLIGHGSPEQKAFYLPRIMSGEDFWCQGYSEPNSGSDLASLQMSAVDDGDHLILNGQKLWTTHGQYANRIFCLVRTSKESIPQKGITFILADMATPGIRVEPIHLISGEHELNSIFFSDVRVPKANVVGAVGNGWTVAKYLLQFERGGYYYAPGLRKRHDKTLDMAKASGSDGGRLIDDADFLARHADISVMIDVLEIMELRIMAAYSSGEPSGSGDSSMIKTRGTEISQAISTLALEAIDHYAMPYQPRAARPSGHVIGEEMFRSNVPPVGPEITWTVTPKYLNDRASSIYGGSNEIQRNIMAKAVLGL